MSRYSNTKVLIDRDGNRYSSKVDYKKFPLKQTDIYHVTTSADRLDLLASRFYGDVSKWWVIAEANSLEVLDFSIRPGIQLRIPTEGV